MVRRLGRVNSLRISSSVNRCRGRRRRRRSRRRRCRRHQPGDDVQEVVAEIAAVDVAGTAGEDEGQAAEARVGDARPREVDRHQRRQQLAGHGVGEGEEGGRRAVAPGRARQAAAYAAPARAREPVAQPGIVADIGERKADQRDRQREDVEQAEARERPFMEDVDPHQAHQAAPAREHQQRQHEAHHQLDAAAAIFEAVAQDGEVVPQIAPDARAAPEARPAQRHQHQHQMAQIDARRARRACRRNAAGSASGPARSSRRP